MSIFVQHQEWQNAISDAFVQMFTVGDGVGMPGGSVKRHETKQKFNVWASGGKVRTYFENAKLNYVAAADGSDVLTSLAVRREVGGTEVGSYSTLQSGITVTKGLGLLSGEITYTINSGEKLLVDCHGQALESGRFMPGTRQLLDPAVGAAGDTLAPTLDGSVSTVYGNNITGWCPGLVMVKTRTPCMSVFGHSLTVARNNFGKSGMTLAANLLGIPCSTFGSGGSKPDAWASNANFEIAAFMGRVMIGFAMVNATNAFAANTAPEIASVTGAAVATATGTGQPVSMADMLRGPLRRFAALGIRIYLITESFPGEGNTQQETDRKIAVWAGWNEWLVTQGAAYYGSIVAGIIDARPYIVQQPYADGVPVAGASTDLHANWTQYRDCIYDHFKPGGAYASALTPATNSYVQSFIEPFYGPAGTPGAAGALPSGWVEWKHNTDSDRLTIDGYGRIKVVNPNTRITHAICTTPLVGSNAAKEFVVRCVSAPWVTQVDHQGLHIGLYDSASTAVNNDTRSGFNHAGYSFRLSVQSGDLKVNYQRFTNETNGGGNFGAQIATVGSGQALAAGDILTVQITRTLVSGNNVFSLLVYRNGVLINTGGNPITFTDSATPAIYQDALYLSVGTAGNTITVHTPNAATWDLASGSVFDATQISQLTGPATLYVPRGGTEPVDILVEQSAPTPGPAVGFPTTAGVSGITGAAVGASSTTDGQGIARYSQTEGVSVPDSAQVGDTGTLTVSAGGVSVQIPIEVVESSGDGSGGGARTIFGGYLT